MKGVFPQPAKLPEPAIRTLLQLDASGPSASNIRPSEEDGRAEECHVDQELPLEMFGIFIRHGHKDIFLYPLLTGGEPRSSKQGLPLRRPSILLRRAVS